MGNYKFCISKEGEKYFFILYPNNNNNQEIGRSSGFSNESDAKEGLYQFQQFIKQNRTDLMTYLTITKKELRFYGELKYNLGSFFRNMGYYDKSEFEQWLFRIIENIDAPLKAE